MDLLTLILIPVALMALYYAFQKILSFFKNDKRDVSTFSSSSEVKTNGTSNAEPEEDDDRPKVVILYGSQSGTAETLAFELEGEAKNFNFNASVFDLEDYNVEDFAKTHFVTVLIATHGEGEPTDSSEQFWEWLKSDEREENEFKDVNFAVFGLGNRQYEFFNSMGRGVFEYFEKYGANKIIELGEGDDDGSLEEDYAEWKDKYWKAARTFLTGDEANDASMEMRPKFIPKFNAVVVNDETRVQQAKCLKIPVDTDKSHKAVIAPVTENREVRQDNSDGSTLHVEFDIEFVDVKYVTADNLSVVPRNNYKLVAKICKRLDVDPKQVIEFKPVDASEHRAPPIHGPCTIQNALLWYTDLTHLPRKAFVTSLIQFAESELEKERLLFLTSNDNKEEYNKWLVDGNLSVYDILLEFSSVKLSIGEFIELLPNLKPREYTISSSHRVQPNRVAITAAIVEETNPNGGAGVCTQYIQELRPEKDSAAIFVKDSSFRYPKDPKTPIIMVGPGTGVAPFRGFVQDGNYMKSQGQELGDWVLSFGCRHRDKDFIYAEELQDAYEKKEGCLSDLYLAFSRDQKEKVYVQHKLSEHADRIWELMNDHNAYIYLCGGTAMGRDIRDVIKNIIKEKSNSTDEQAAEVLRDMQSSGRFISELWG